ncbi:ABC transporter substrate-binding protein [Amycolatopsis sp. K13G38]|uniref:ABC transporter substrate-binding protein n=1 Tax=Amycolatopsis acididurans TaxID=2724524 RepID=A0ABX1J5Q5_9PSEU|nr:ABC transporter substrate-binding protein [Amycolatopsis acididurans]NKQ55155.1 ABC transporter substrate-binding protein [Amycolatopsis acididurans]
MRRVAIMLVAALSVIGGCSSAGDSGQSAGDGSLERSTLRVGVGNPVDTAPLRLAVADGSFTRAGLDVTLVEEPTVQDGLAGLSSGNLDVAFATDVAFLNAAAGGTALEFQGEAYTSAPYTMSLVTLPGSGYTDLAAKKTPRIAVDDGNGLGKLAVDSMFTTAGADPGKIKFITRSFDRMADALRDGSADAALLVEPYLTVAQENLGAEILADSSRGATTNFPVSSYASSGMFARANPRTLATFRKVLADAQQRAAADQSAVRQALPKFTGIDATTAALVTLGEYPTSLNGVRLQRVADLMHSTGMLTDRLDVPSLLPKTS